MPDISAAAGQGNRCYATALRKASRVMSQFYDAALEDGGLRITQRAILATLRREGPMTIGVLAKALAMNPGGLAHTLKPLVRDELLSIRPDPSSKRSKLVQIEPEGINKLRATDAGFDSAQMAFERALGKKDAEAMRDALTVLSSEHFLQRLRSAF